MNDSRKLIVFQSENGPSIGGSDKYLGHLIDSMDPCHWEVALLVRPGYPLHRICQTASRVTQLHVGPALSWRDPHPQTRRGDVVRPSEMKCRRKGWGRVWQCVPRPVRRDVGLWRDVRRVERMLTELRPAIFHSMDGGAQPAAVGAARAGARVVMSYCAPPPERPLTGFRRRLEKQALGRASAMIVKSDFARQAWARYLKTSSDRIEVIANGIDWRAAQSADSKALRAELGIDPNQLVLGMTGRLEPEKGVHVLAEAIPELLRRFSNVTVVIAGDGSGVGVLEELRARSSAAGRIHLLGFRHDVQTITAGYDVAMIPSVWDEPFGWVALEAMAAGKPVVASRVGGLPEVVQHDRTGFLVGPNSAPELVEAVSRLVEDDELRAQLGTEGRQRVMEVFSNTQMIQRTHHVYQRLIGGALEQETRRSA